MALKSSIAGSWYPGTAAEIRAAAEAWEDAAAAEDAASSSPATAPNVILLPHAGWAYSGATAWSAVRRVRGAKFRRVVILAPSHRAWIEDRLVAPESDAVSTPLGEIAIDRDWLDRLALIAPVQKSDAIHRNEHSAQIEFPLIQLALGDGFKIVPLVMGVFGQDQKWMCARALSRLMDAETLLVISSDFTHYGTDFSYAPFGTNGSSEVRQRVATVDAQAIAMIEKCDAGGFITIVESTGATICGRVPIELALRSFPSGTKSVLAKYATSSDGDGDFTRFVCYAAMTAHAHWLGDGDAVLDADARAYLLRVARDSMQRAVKSGKCRKWSMEDFPDAPIAVQAKMGAFVTLNDRVTGALRGCIGEILPMRPLVIAVAARAADSALNDPRFPAVTERELSSLRVEVSALTPPKPVESWQDIVIGRDGMTLEKNGCFAVFLPQVAPEQAWDLPTTLTYLSMKAGLTSDAWRSGATFEVFQAEVFHE